MAFKREKSPTAIRSKEEDARTQSISSMLQEIDDFSRHLTPWEADNFIPNITDALENRRVTDGQLDLLKKIHERVMSK
jgi:hypothetical protein